MSLPSRRDVLRAGGVSFIALAGCANQSEPPDDTTKVSQTTRTRTTRRQTQTQTDTTQKTTKKPVECSLDSLPEEGWPLPDRDPANTNYAPTATSLAEKPSVRWRQEAKPPKSHEHMRVQFTNPVVTGDRVFVGKELLPDTHTEMPDENALHAYDRATGKRIWTYSTGDETPRSVATTNDTVYVSTWSRVHAVDKTTRANRWTLHPDDGVATAVPADGRVYVGTESEVVFSVRPNGNEEWRSSVSDRVTARLAISDGSVFVGTDDGTVSALGADDGQNRWSKSLTSSNSNDSYSVRNLTVTGCGLLGTANGNLFALDPDGSVRWRATGNHTALSTDGTTVYAGTADGHLRALSIADGSPQWKASLGIADSTMADGIYQDPVVADGSVYVSSRHRGLYSLDAGTGRERWRLTFDSLSPLGKPVVVRDDLLVSVAESLVALA